MTFIKSPVTGMRDILPEEKFLRERAINIIRQTYLKYGFTEIECPLVEHLENLNSRQGGDNEKLIFKVLKRGDKLIRSLSTLNEADLSSEKAFSLSYENLISEEGLRYDLTVPLCRYFANNFSHLSLPFKALQIGSVFRADRPQKGRYRQFTQCDIDILGDGTTLAEKELILATYEALNNIGFSKYNFYIVINDRTLLTELIKNSGFSSEDIDEILIILDKWDKIGRVGIKAQLESKASPEKVEKLMLLISDYSVDSKGVLSFAKKIGSAKAMESALRLAEIIDFVTNIRGKNIKLQFCPTLVRGMGYYTGTIFEIKIDSLSQSVGGGGRYDKMIGRFTGRDVAAVGFSIGFERIMNLIMEGEKNACLNQDDKTAWLIEKGMTNEKLSDIFEAAMALRDHGKHILLVWMAKNKKFQKESIFKSGYTDIKEFFVEDLKNKIDLEDR